jgi:chromosome segregation protein
MKKLLCTFAIALTMLSTATAKEMMVGMPAPAPWKNTKIDELQKQISDLRNQMYSLKREVAPKLDENEELQNLQKTIEEQSRAIEKQMTDLQDKARARELEITKEVSPELYDLVQERNQLSKKLETLYEKTNKLEQQKSKENVTVGDQIWKARENDKTIKEIGMQIEKLWEPINKNQQIYNDKRNAITKQLSPKIDELQQQISKLQTERQALINKEREEANTQPKVAVKENPKKPGAK